MQAADDALPPTERVDPATQGLDTLPTRDLVALLAGSGRRAVTAVEEAAPAIAAAVDKIAVRLAAGGSLHYVGAGTSGRLGFLDASEAPPTFGTPPSLVRAHIAGGPGALIAAVEGAEDDGDAGAREMLEHVRPGDVVVGISASGGAAYVTGAIEAARAIGAYTVAITGHGESALAAAAERSIVLDTGAEPLAGSTRLVAGTAQKLALNALSTATMVRLNKVYDNLMVDVVVTNAKLRGRAERLVRMLGPADEAAARVSLDAASGNVKTAVVMLRRSLDAAAARELLDSNAGSLRESIEEPRVGRTLEAIVAIVGDPLGFQEMVEDQPPPKDPSFRGIPPEGARAGAFWMCNPGAGMRPAPGKGPAGICFAVGTMGAGDWFVLSACDGHKDEFPDAVS